MKSFAYTSACWPVTKLLAGVLERPTGSCSGVISVPALG